MSDIPDDEWKRVADLGRLYRSDREWYEAATAPLRARIKELEDALRDALEGFEDGSNYKGDYLREKHGDPEEIARLRALLNEGSE